MCYGCMCPCRPYWLRRRRWRKCVGSGLSQWDGTLCISSDSNSFSERRKQMKTLRLLALVYSLLIVGIIIALVPSEALPSLKITTFLDGYITIDFTSTTGTCSLSDKNSGYTACYPIVTKTYGTLDSWIIGSVSSTNPARLLIADTTGAGNS